MAKKRARSATEKHRKKQKRKQCNGSDCTKRPCFGPLGGPQTSAIFCKTHVPKEEPDKWEDVVHKRCEGITSDGHACKKNPNYGPLGGDPKSARYCNSCVPEGERHMWENVKAKRCEGITSDGHACKTRPKFGPVNGDKKSARFCARCIPDRENWEDVVSKRCEGITSEGHACKKKPSYGPLGGIKSSARFCARCIPDRENWEDVVSKRCEGITSEGHACKTQPHFGQVSGDKTARFCARCIPVEDRENWEDVVNKRCAQEGCSTQTGKKYRGYCLHCFANLFPLESVSRNYKTKERLVIQGVDELLKRDFTHLEVTYDKQVVGGCSRRRPDIAVDVLTHVIIVECDEDGHNTEDYCTCENKRMMQLFQDYGNRPFVLIRFNPDAYVNSHGLKIASCFSRTKTGLVKLVKEEMWTERLRVLQERLQVHLVNIPGSELSVEHLYYEGFH